MSASIMAIFIAQILVLTTLHFVRKAGRWRKRGRAGLGIFFLEVLYVTVCLIAADLIRS